MLILKTIKHETLWGGNRLETCSNNKNTKIGHLYSLVSNEEFESEILNGEFKGLTLGEFFKKNKHKYNLQNYRKFPFTISLTDASENLSIQVHPNDKFVQANLNMPHGKNESWYFIEQPYSRKIYNGCKSNSIEELQHNINTNNFKDIIDYLEVQPEDYVYVEAGTLHSLPAGSLVYEIEENCNITYRLYDFDRVDKDGNKRKLQIEDVIKTIDINLKSKAEPFDCEKTERFYSTKLFKNTTTYTNKSNTIECLTVIKGNSTIENFNIKQGSTIILEPNEKIELGLSDFIIARPIVTKEDK